MLVSDDCGQTTAGCKIYQNVLHNITDTAKFAEALLNTHLKILPRYNKSSHTVAVHWLRSQNDRSALRFFTKIQIYQRKRRRLDDSNIPCPRRRSLGVIRGLFLRRHQALTIQMFFLQTFYHIIQADEITRTRTVCQTFLGGEGREEVERRKRGWRFLPRIRALGDHRVLEEGRPFITPIRGSLCIT